MILFPLLTFVIWLQVFTSVTLLKRRPILVPDARPNAEQGHSDGGNPIQ